MALESLHPLELPDYRLNTVNPAIPGGSPLGSAGEIYWDEQLYLAAQVKGTGLIAEDSEYLPVAGTRRMWLVQTLQDNSNSPISDDDYPDYPESLVTGSLGSRIYTNRKPLRNRWGEPGMPLRAMRFMVASGGAVGYGPFENLESYTDFLDEHGIYVYGASIWHLTRDSGILTADNPPSPGNTMLYPSFPERCRGGIGMTVFTLGVSNLSSFDDIALFYRRALRIHEQQFLKHLFIFIYDPAFNRSDIYDDVVNKIVIEESTPYPNAQIPESIWLPAAQELFGEEA